jgi:hypothetical protein
VKFLAIWRRLASVASFASRATNLFPSSRLASATKIVRPLKSTVAMQPQLQPGIAEIVSDDLPRLHARSVLRSFQSATNGWLCWRRISSSNYDAHAGWLLYAVDCLRNEDLSDNSQIKNSSYILANPIRFRHSDFCRTLSETFRETSFRRFRRINLVEACFLPARCFSLEPSPRARRHERPYHGCRGMGEMLDALLRTATQQIGSQSPAAVYRDLAAS